MKENLKVLQAFVDSMKATSSLNVKKTIINAYGKQHFIKNALVYAYDPYKKYYVTSKTCKKNKELCDMNKIHDCNYFFFFFLPLLMFNCHLAILPFSPFDFASLAN